MKERSALTGLCSKGTSISKPGSQLCPANPPAPPSASSLTALTVQQKRLHLDGRFSLETSSTNWPWWRRPTILGVPRSLIPQPETCSLSIASPQAFPLCSYFLPSSLRRIQSAAMHHFTWWELCTGNAKGRAIRAVQSLVMVQRGPLCLWCRRSTSGRNDDTWYMASRAVPLRAPPPELPPRRVQATDLHNKYLTGEDE
ncbi:hypothetical protein GW17_00014135 [Ensete ventricosum]|nr:hypothetical protein GW17_00014135 [Ensete ventricosum]RZR79838.1 hypothetical protein BHM03_00005680 [Ensete ventricosum]